MSRAAASLLLTAGFAAFAPVVAAQNHDHEHERGHDLVREETASLAPQTASVARRLWTDLVCLCGRCPRLRLSECRCRDGKEERSRVLDLLRGRDLSTLAGTERAYQEVVAAYIQRFGGRHVLAREGDGEKSRTEVSDPTPLVALGGLLALCGVVFVLLERRRARSSSKRRRRRAR